MNALRSIVFNFLYVFGSLVVSLLLVWTFAFPPRKCAELVGTLYGGYMSFIEKYVLGLKLEMRGLENLPADTPYIIAAKHQSAFETLKIPFMKSLRSPVIILKKELTYLPLWGLYPVRMGEVAIDRSKGAKALRAISAGCQKAIDDGRSVAIFPQGTRVKPGAVAEYKTGIAKIYRDLKVPIVPLALNSGVFWGKNSFFKKSGTVVFEFLPPIPPGLPPLQVMEQLETQIEAASDKLVQEAGGPALPRQAPAAQSADG
jgi:1-acyl-sn-glycerol-3-phosphate acyltransferase